MTNIKWAFLCSSWGRNAKDVIQTYEEQKQIHKIGLVLYESEPCGAADLAKKNGVNTLLIKPEQFETKRLYQLKILEKLKLHDVTHIFLLGYAHLIRKDILNAFPNKIINVHPSLLPSFRGTKTAIHDALDYGVKVTGVTTHIIDEEYDRGIILFQEAMGIEDGDTFETLYPRYSKIALSTILKTMDFIENQD
ncbi:formyltransferase family protein [Allomuricauda sp. d1]|uniref:formyltransferase family protein n=1 Tax=Allomuricauda sp. d1 TaxID=3136725 RepID=UPI0031E0CD65